LTHGNGPQVGELALERAAASFDVLGAESMGQIGYVLAQAMSSAGCTAVPILTQVSCAWLGIYLYCLKYGSVNLIDNMPFFLFVLFPFGGQFNRWWSTLLVRPLKIQPSTWGQSTVVWKLKLWRRVWDGPSNQMENTIVE
jgi:hypothetical protein